MKKSIMFFIGMLVALSAAYSIPKEFKKDNPLEKVLKVYHLASVDMAVPVVDMIASNYDYQMQVPVIEINRSKFVTNVKFIELNNKYPEYLARGSVSKRKDSKDVSDIFLKRRE